jgi:hypothetical protein
MLLLTFNFSLLSAYAQIPQAINFQAIARDGSGNPMITTNIQIRLSVIDSAQSGTIVYQELRALQTNDYGSFSFQIGVNPAFITIGTFQNINWETGKKHLKIDYDPTNTFNFSLTLGIIKFVTVPYAFASESVVFIDATGAQNGDVLAYNSSLGKFKPVASSADGSETKVQAGINVTVTGTGTTANPYIVNSTASGSLTPGTTTGDILYWNGTTWILLHPGTTGQVLAINGSNIPAWQNASASNLIAPTATTLAATDLQITTATLNGNVNANGLSSTVVFEWGLTTAYGSNATATQSPVTGTSNTAVSAPLTGLQGNTTYHYRIKATNAVNITYSSDMSFTTTFPLVPTVTTSNFTDVKGNSAKAGGSITNNGGSTVTAQGLCWSTSPNPTIANGVNTSFTAVMSVLSPNTVYYVRAYATNIAGTGYGNQISFNSGYVMGSTYGGGLVFYNDGAAHGLVCASTDQSTGAEWGCYGTAINGTLTAINTGAANTNAIVLGCTTAGIAAKLCYDLVLNTYTDWYLPAKDELNLMYLNLHTQSLGGFAGGNYWSSSEYAGYEALLAWYQSFSSGIQNDSGKDYTAYVRAVRAF